MPVDRSRYPTDWEEISAAVRFGRAGGRCEGSPVYPDCRAEHGQPHPVTGARVVLTVGHLDHDPQNNDPANLRAWCQRCHNRYDVAFRRLNRASRRRVEQVEAGQMEMEV